VKKNKLSRGLTKLIKKKTPRHFSGYADEFVENPAKRSEYLDHFNVALIVEISKSDMLARY
jgi:hypothetical protein